jgi:hypothetical protein
MKNDKEPYRFVETMHRKNAKQGVDMILDCENIIIYKETDSRTPSPSR